MAGIEGAVLGEVVVLLLEGGGGSGARVDDAPGGGGNGAMLLLSLAAAAAAAEAYFRVSPGALDGGGAGFMLGAAEPFVAFAKGVCNVARAGNGDFN